MSIRSKRDIYRLIEKHLMHAEEPMTCVDLMDIEEIAQEAMREFGQDKSEATNKLSDTLGFMWRRNVLSRYMTTGASGQKARYAYAWANKEEPGVKTLPPHVRAKTGITVQEREDGVMIEFEKFFVFIRPK